MLLYSMLYLTGYGLELDDLKEFRQWGSRTAGHPERGHAPGIEVTTGPLGQGFGNGVGIGIVERHLRERFGEDVCNHHVFAICSDGDLEEGVSHETASLAGHLGLGRLVYVYDDNHISIDGPTELSYSDDVRSRFEGYHWHVVQLGEVSEDLDALERGLRDGMAVEDRPTLLILRSHIGYPSPKYTDTAHAHGNALGADEVAQGQGDPRHAAGGLLGSRRRARLLPPGGRAGPRCTRRVARSRAARSESVTANWARSSTSFSPRAAVRDGSRSSRPGTPARASPPARRARPRWTRSSTWFRA